MRDRSEIYISELTAQSSRDEELKAGEVATAARLLAGDTAAQDVAVVVELAHAALANATVMCMRGPPHAAAYAVRAVAVGCFNIGHAVQRLAGLELLGHWLWQR